MVGKWRTSGTQRWLSRRIPARYAALCIPGYGRVPSLCDERVQTDHVLTFIQPLFGGRWELCWRHGVGKPAPF